MLSIDNIGSYIANSEGPYIEMSFVYASSINALLSNVYASSINALLSNVYASSINALH